MYWGRRKIEELGNLVKLWYSRIY